MAEDSSPQLQQLRDEIRRNALLSFDVSRSKLDPMLRNGESMKSDAEVRACLALALIAAKKQQNGTTP